MGNTTDFYELFDVEFGISDILVLEFLVFIFANLI